ncbi:hypothetical protein V9T40_014939 [Parthenolecanium corni]|uniref:Uncharacterized protein n=1 Tax=Parthenolecanium corni TaxID=536013 RepID=A0AAN9TKE3_9HEMI
MAKWQFAFSRLIVVDASADRFQDQLKSILFVEKQQPSDNVVRCVSQIADYDAHYVSVVHVEQRDDLLDDDDGVEGDNEQPVIEELVEKNLNDLEVNSKSLLESIEALNMRSDCYIDELESEVLKLEKNIENTLGPFWQRIKNGIIDELNVSPDKVMYSQMFDAKCYIKEIEEELQRLGMELMNKENMLTNLRNELKDVKNTLFIQSSYTASLGATLCTLLWRACGDKLIASDLLKQRKLVDFLKMIPDSLRSFFQSFGENLPSVKSQEYQFILSMIGIITNLTAVSEGRQFLTECKEGYQIIQELLEMVSDIPKSGIHIHRTIMMVLYNVSLDERGTQIISNDPRILSLLMKNISQPDEKLRYVSLRLFQSLAHDARNADFLETLHEAIYSVNLEELLQRCKDEEKVIIAQITDNVALARQNLQNEPGADEILDF